MAITRTSAATAYETGAIAMSVLARVRHSLKLDRAAPRGPEGLISTTRVNLAQLEQSQGKLKNQLGDTGFFLGDALIIKRLPDERDRAIHNHS